MSSDGTYDIERFVSFSLLDFDDFIKLRTFRVPIVLQYNLTDWVFLSWIH